MRTPTLSRAAGTLAAALALVAGAAPAMAGIGYQDAVHDRGYGDAYGVDVWVDAGGEDPTYDTGDVVQLTVRPHRDSYVVVYGVDVDGMAHLIYPYHPHDPHYLRGGRSYVVNAPFLEVGPLEGMVYVQALACAYPLDPYFPDWFYAHGHRTRPYYLGASRSPIVQFGFVTGDPYLAFAELRASILPRGCAPHRVGFRTVYWGVRTHRYYPRYVCNDCHYGGWYDPYRDACRVFDVRVDVWWTDALYPARCQPRFYYWKRANAPHRYRSYKTKWSSKDRWEDGRPDRLIRTFAGKSPRERDHLKDRKDHPSWTRGDHVSDAHDVRGTTKPVRDRDGALDSRGRDDRGTRPDRGDRGDRNVDRGDRGDRGARDVDRGDRDDRDRDAGRGKRDRGARPKRDDSGRDVQPSRDDRPRNVGDRPRNSRGDKPRKSATPPRRDDRKSGDRGRSGRSKSSGRDRSSGGRSRR